MIGGGPAGAALAAELARAGRKVTVYERETEAKHKVCGEFLSVEACAYLAGLGIDLPALGAVPIETVRLWHGRRSSSAALPFRAMSLSRKVLDEALLTRAGELGAKVRRGVRVAGLNQGLRGWRVRLDGSVEESAGQVFLAVGKHDLKDWRRPPGAQSDLVGLKMHWRLTPTETAYVRGAVELFLFPGGYAGLELVEEGAANLCALVRRDRLKALSGGWDQVLAAMSAACPVLAERLAGAEPLWPRPLAVAGLPYGHIQSGGGGPWRIGDQGAVIPSFAGDGLAIALHSARLAARTYLRGGGSEAYHEALSRDLAAQMGRAVWLSRAMVRPWSQGLLAAAARARPGLLTTTARATRISDGALARSPRARRLRPLATS